MSKNDNWTTTSSDNLEKKLQEAQATQSKKADTASLQDLEQTIQHLEHKLQEAEMIAKKAQSDYINLKFDFDSYMARNQQQAQHAQSTTLIDVVKKFIPFINGLHQSLSNIPEWEQDDDIVQGVQMVYDKFLATLEQLSIFKIESIWREVDINLHEAVSALEVEDKKQKWKIIQEYEQGFVYRSGDIEKVILPSKVVVAN